MSSNAETDASIPYQGNSFMGCRRPAGIAKVSHALGSTAVNLVALVDWLIIKLHKRQPGERDIPVPAKARPGSESRWVGGTMFS